MGTPQSEAPRRGITRLTPAGIMAPAEYELRQDERGTTMVGYAAVFDQWADIDTWEGRFIERLKRGAFARTIGPNRAKADGPIRVLFNHGMDPTLGMKPLGVPKVVRENTRGLWTETPLDPTSYNEDLKALLRSGALSGMSFTFDVLADEWEVEDERRRRTITEVRLYEFGPVTWPAYQETTAGVRSGPHGTVASSDGTARLDDQAPATSPPGVPPEVVEQIMRQERELRVLARQHGGETDGDGRNPETPVRPAADSRGGPEGDSVRS